jgi:hypothetical protein
VARYRRALERGVAAEDVRALLRLMDRLLRVPEGSRAAAIQAMRQVEEDFAVTYITSYEELGLEKGRAEGRAEAGRTLVLRIATKRFGTLEEGLAAQIAGLPVERLDDLALALLDFAGLDELRFFASGLDDHRPGVTLEHLKDGATGGSKGRRIGIRAGRRNCRQQCLEGGATLV